MNNKKTILIVDDSRIFRSIIENALKGHDDIDVIGSVWNGLKAMEFIQTTPPDVVTLDIDMPKMNGLEALKNIMIYNQSNPNIPDIGVVIVSAKTHKGADITIEALESGAFEFVAKPSTADPKKNFDILKDKLLKGILQFCLKDRKKKPEKQKKETPTIRSRKTTNLSKRKEAIVIGASTGGPKALSALLPELSHYVDLPIFIVQHMPPIFTKSLAESLDKKCKHLVVEASDEEFVKNNCIYIAPGGKHMLLRKNKKKQISISINHQEPENGCRPSVDVLFRSVVNVYENKVIAVILTGMGSDGTKGLGALKRVGTEIIAQDEESSVVWGMPGSAVEAGYVDKIVPIAGIPITIKNMLT